MVHYKVEKLHLSPHEPFKNSIPTYIRSDPLPYYSLSLCWHYHKECVKIDVLTDHIITNFSSTDHGPLCHAPITEDAAEQVLRKHFAEGNFLIRESGTIDNAYTLSLCHNKQILRYRIICDSDGTYSFNFKNDEQEQRKQCCQIVHARFPTLHDLINSHKQNTVRIE